MWYILLYADIRGYNGITPPISLGYVNRLRWISTIFFSGVPFQVVWIPIQLAGRTISFIWWSVWNLEHVSNFPPLNSVRFGGQKYVPKLGPPKTNSKRWIDILWHGRCPSLPFSNTPKKTVYISHLSMCCFFVLQSPHFFGSYGWQPGFFRSARLSALLGRARRRWDLAAGSFHFIFISFHFFIIPSPLFWLASQWRW